jgi:hypothetical protein
MPPATKGHSALIRVFLWTGAVVQKLTQLFIQIKNDLCKLSHLAAQVVLMPQEIWLPNSLK